MKFDILNTNAKTEKPGRMPERFNRNLPADIRRILFDAGQAAKFMVAGVSLAPHWLAGTGRNMCVGSTPQCRAACNLWWSGRCVTENVRNAMIRRTKELVADPLFFRKRVEFDIRRLLLEAEAADCVPVLRPNMASDHLPELLDWIAILREFEGSGLIAYDYTKRLDFVLRDDLPSNYWLTYSRSERTTDSQLDRVFSAGRNVAAVFDVPYHASGAHKFVGQLPKRWNGRRLVDGDVHDLRFLDPPNSYVGLRLKGTNASKDEARISANGQPFGIDVSNIRAFAELEPYWIENGFRLKSAA